MPAHPCKIQEGSVASSAIPVASFCRLTPKEALRVWITVRCDIDACSIWSAVIRHRWLWMIGLQCLDRGLEILLKASWVQKASIASTADADRRIRRGLTGSASRFVPAEGPVVCDGGIARCGCTCCFDGRLPA